MRTASGWMPVLGLRMTLRLLTTSDADALFRTVDAARGDLVRWFEWPDRVTSPEAAAVYIAEVQACSRIKLWWLIYDDDVPVGGIQLRLRYGGEAVSLPYWLVPSARGKGLATAAVKQALTIAKLIGFRKARFVIAVDNTASCNLALRVGLSPVGEPYTTMLRGCTHRNQAYELRLAEGANA